MQAYNTLLEQIGPKPTDDDLDSIIAFIVSRLPMSQWRRAAEQAGFSQVYTDISMRLGECGIY
jgi:hypothetical protein